MIERVPLDTPPQVVVMSFAHNHLTDLFISIYTGAAVFGAKYLMENEFLKFLACLKYRKRLESSRLSVQKANDNLKHGNWLAVFSLKVNLVSSMYSTFLFQKFMNYMSTVFSFLFFFHILLQGGK